MTNIRWVIPQALEPVSDALPQGSQALTLAGNRQLRIGLLDNTKDNAHLLLTLIGQRVQTQFNAQLLYRRKGNATVGAPVAILDELARETDCILTAMAD